MVDSFAGGGGTSVGFERAFGRSPDLAVNHDPEAIAMHAANHPGTRHLISNVHDVDIALETGGRPVEVLWLSPDCTYHSKARGGKPHRDRNRARRIRGLANIAVKWAAQLGHRKPRVICLENVEEWVDWCPLGEDGLPDALRKGSNFRRFVKQLQNLGYTVDWQLLRASDYGAPTTRNRLFLVARADGQPIEWPEPTHGPGLQPYRTAAECIDWSIPCPSIFDRRKPLAENTLRRIARGMWKYVITSPEPFIVGLAHGEHARGAGSRSHPIHEPMRTIHAGGNNFAVVTPIIVGAGGPAYGGKPVSAGLPFGTLTTENHRAIVAPTLIQTGWGERSGQAPRALDIEAPLGTIMAGGNKHALVAAFLAKHYGGHETPGSAISRPFDTITARDHHALIASHLVKFKGTSRDGQPVTEPLHTIQASGNHYGEVRAFLMKYHRDGGQLAALRDPMPTVLANDSLGLVTVHGAPYAIVDIGMRMLQPRELYAAQGVGRDYRIDIEVERTLRGKTIRKPLTKEAQVRMCGNMVSPPPAEALLRANLQHVALSRPL